MRKFTIAVPTTTDIAAAAKASRLSFAQQIQKLGKAAEPTTAEQKAARAAEKEQLRKNKIAAKIAKLKAQL